MEKQEYIHTMVNAGNKLLRSEELSSKIIQARNDYYNEQPTVSDQVFDAWVDELKGLDPNNKAVTMVGAESPASEWKLEKHLLEMGSLFKCSTDQEIEDWIKKVNQQDFVLSYKIDGLSIECIYEEGKFVKALTRNDGKNGFNVSSNVVKMQGFVRELPQKISCSLRGEIFLKKSDHQKYFSEYSNARNAASGICKRLDGQGSQHLSLMFYELVSDDIEFGTEQDKFLYLSNNLHLETPYYGYYPCEEECVISSFRDVQNNERDLLAYDVDGMVLTINSVSKQLDLGSTNMRPKYSMALKFEAECKETLVKDIIFQTGSSGRITPVAIVEPVSLAGAMVERCTLNNISFMQNLGVGVGSTVLIKRAGEIIPYICSVIYNKCDVKYPERCHVCDSLTEFRGEYLICPNLNCKAQISGRIKNWVNNLNLLDVGDTLIDRLVESDKINSIAGLYKLTIEDLLSIERMGEKSANVVLKAISSNKELTLEKFLGSLSIPSIGESIIALLTGAGYNTLQSIRDANIINFIKINGFGDVKSENLYKGLKQYSNLIDELLYLGIVIKEKSGKFLNKSFCFTGTLSIKRADAEKMVEDAGGSIKSVGKGLDYLVIADPNSNSAKVIKAKKIGTKVLSEGEFLNFFNIKKD